ncbi:MAG: hypothetical protein PHF00_10470 [Elusimicrobia bacterium]|nr:hypothetical protein [Elusimicrobiota bacterium]
MSGAREPSARLVRLLGVLAAAAVLAAFAPILGNGFVNWDDYGLIVRNEAFRGVAPRTLAWMFSSLYYTTYQPLGWLLYDLVYLVQGARPFGFHLLSLLIHLGNAALVYRTVLRLLESGADPGPGPRLSALLGALLWALHPLQVESVAWATELPDLLGTSFFLASFLAYLRADGRPRRLALSLAFFIGSGLSRWKGFGLPLALVLADAACLGRLDRDPRRWPQARFRRVWLEKLPFFLVAFAVALVNWRAKEAVGTLTWTLPGAARALAFYLGKLLAPVGLYPLYLLDGHPDAVSWPWPACAAAVAAVTAALALVWRRWPGGLAVWLFFGACVLPTTAAYGGRFVCGQDHYLYLAGLGFPAAAAWVFAAGWRRWRREASLAALVPLAAGLAAACWYGALSRRQCFVWRDSVSLWSHALAVNPASPMAPSNLTGALVAAGRADEALRRIAAQLAEDPGRQADPDRRESAWARREILLSQLPRYYNDLAVDLARRGRLDEAAALLEKSLALAPDQTPARDNLERLRRRQARRPGPG